METKPSDPELLADWVGHRREPAFHALVARYAGLVHMTARRTCGDDSMAAEAAQLTFIPLARKAKSLTSCASLGGWLHITASDAGDEPDPQIPTRKPQTPTPANRHGNRSHPTLPTISGRKCSRCSTTRSPLYPKRTAKPCCCVSTVP